MAVINNTNLKAIDVGFQQNFQDGLSEIEPQWQRFATEVPSTSHSNTYGWLGEMPELREWIGDRVLKDIATHDYTIKNRDFESTISVKANDIEDDNLGVYKPLASAHGRSAGMHTDKLVFAALKGGTSSLCYDGQNFFDTDHPVYPNHDGTGTPEAVSNYDAGASGNTNPTWFLLDCSQVVKPIIYQNRKNPELKAMINPDDEVVFTRNVYRWGAHKRGDAGYGFWQMAHASKLELNAENLIAAIAKMEEREADGGTALDIKPTLLIVPPSLKAKAKELVMAEKINGSTNILKGELEVLSTARVK